jgi:hypothetical protein
MDITGQLRLRLIGVNGRPVRDPKTKIKIIGKRSGKEAKFTAAPFPAVGKSINIIFPDVNIGAEYIFCEIKPKYYYDRAFGPVLLRNRSVIQRDIIVPRDKKFVEPRFVKWNNLSNHFRALKEVIKRSPNIRLKKGGFVGPFVGNTYDNPANKNIVLAKAALLNLYAKMIAISVPSIRGKTWFSYVKEIIVIDRERFLAFVDPKIARIVQFLIDNKGYSEFKHSHAQPHIDNVPRDIRDNFRKNEIISIKSKEFLGNLQLTIIPGKGVNPAYILDVDIDEHGELIQHIIDVGIRHKKTGGTHPYDIHEILSIYHPNIPLGYRLEIP